MTTTEEELRAIAARHEAAAPAMAEIQRLISDPAFRAAAARDPRSLQEHRDIGTLLGLLRERTEERDALRGMVRKLAGYLESANELLEEQGEDEEDCADFARLVAEARALIGEPAAEHGS